MLLNTQHNATYHFRAMYDVCQRLAACACEKTVFGVYDPKTGVAGCCSEWSQDLDILTDKHTFDDFDSDICKYGRLKITDNGKEVLEEALFLVAASEEVRGLLPFRVPHRLGCSNSVDH